MKINQNKSITMTETTKIKIELWLTFDEIELICKTLREIKEKEIKPQPPRGKRTGTYKDICGDGLFGI
jgi:hypothetical protein